MQQKVIGALCVAAGLAAVLVISPTLGGAQQLHKVPNPAPITGTKWMLAESAGQRVAQNGFQPYLELKTVERYEDGSAGDLEGVSDSCGDDLAGTYRATNGRLHVSITSVPLRECKLSEGMAREGLGTILDGNPRFRIVGSELDLLERNGVVRARFVAADRE